MNTPHSRTFPGRGLLVRRWVGALQIFLSVFSLFASSLTVPVAPALAATGVNRMISYQAHLGDATGFPVTDGAYNIKFSLYDAETGGTRLWTAAGTTVTPSAISVDVQKGLFTVLLGDSGQNTLDTVDWNTDSLYLGITIGSDSEMTPRRRLASAAQAFNANQLQGQYASGTAFGSSSLFTINQTSNTAATGTRSALQVQSSGTSNANDLLIRGINDTGSDVFTLNRQGSVTTTGGLNVLGTGTSTIAGSVSTTYANISQNLLVNGQPVCLADGTNCSGTAASTSTLQQITNNGASTTNQLYLFGGLISASSTVTSTFTVLGATALGVLTATNATFTQVTTTNLGASVVSTTQLYVASQLVCLQSGTNCPGSTETLATVSARGNFATTTLQLYGGFLASSSTVTSTLTVIGATTLGTLTATNATFTNVTTTSLFANTVSTTQLYVNGRTVCLTDGTSCGYAATTATLQQITDNGATTNNTLNLQGGFVSGSSTVTSTFTVLGATALQTLTATNATFTQVTSSFIGAGVVSTTQLYVSSQLVCLQTGTNCPSEADTLASVSARGNFATTTLQLYGGFIGSSSTVTSTFTVIGGTTLGTLTFTQGTGTSVTTTNLFATNGTITNANFTAATSSVWLGFATASGTTVHASSILVNGIDVCLQNGTNCPGSAATTATLQQVSDNGASTTNELYFFGGFLTASSTVTSTFAVLGDTSLQGTTLTNATATSVTTTNLFGTNGTFTNLLFTNGTSTNWFGFTTASGTTVHAASVLVNGFNVCLENGSNCPGTPESTSTLQQISNNGASTTNELYLFGGYIASSSTVTSTFTVLGDTSLQNMTFVDGTSSNWFGFADASGTTLNSSAVFVNGIAVCLQNGTNCPVSYSTDTLASVTARGATTSEILTLGGGFIVPGRPATSTLGSVDIDAQPYHMFLQDHYAYLVGASSDILQVIDVNDPAHPAVLSTVSTAVDPVGIYVQGRYAYIAADNGDSFQVFDVSNPSAPSLLSTVAADHSSIDVTAHGNYAYVISDNNNSLQVYDVGNPNGPVRVNTIGTGTQPSGIFMSGRYIYVVNFAADQLEIFDAFDPSAPVSVGTATVGTHPISVYVEGRYAYVVNIGSDSLSIVDVADPSAPVQVATTTVDTGPEAVYVQGNVAYVANNSSSTLQLIDVSSSTAPFSMGSVSTANLPVSVSVQGRYAYVASESGKFEVFDTGGAYIQQLQAGGIDAGTLSVRGTLQAESGDFRGGIFAGTGGLFSAGPLSVYSTGTTSTFWGVVSTTQLYVTGQLVCLANGTNCSGTAASTSTLQDVTNNGATTTNELHLLGGFIGSSSTVTSTFTVLGATALQTLTATNATFTQVTSTFVGAGTVSTTQLYVMSQLVCLQNGSNCPGSSDTLASVSARGNFATTTLELYGGFLASSSTVTSTLTVIGATTLGTLTATNATITAVTSTVWLGFSSASGSTLRASSIFVNGISVCLQDGTNCPGSAATTATLQQISNNGATTTNELYLLGGLIAPSSTVTGTLTVLGTTALQTLTATNATFTQVTTTNLGASVVSTTQLYVSSQLVCLQTGTNCPGEADTLASVSARGNFATTTLQLYGGFIGSSSTVTSTFTVIGGTTLGTLTFTQGTGTSVTTTNLFSTNGTITNLTGTNATFQAVTSTVWLGFATASGTSVHASSILVNGIDVCLQNGTNCPGSAATTATLQQVSNNGASTTNELYFFGGFLASSSTVTSTFTVLGNTSLQGTTITNATATSVTTTNLFGTNGTFTNLLFANGTSSNWFGFSTASGTTLNAAAVLVNGFNVCLANGTNCPGSAASTSTLQQISNNGASTTNELYLFGGYISSSSTVTSTFTVLGGTSLQSVTFVNGTSSNWFGFATASGTTLNASGVFVNGQPVCLAGGTNCPGTAATTATLQQISNNGATTTNELYLLGGLIAPSSTVTSSFHVIGSATNSSAVTIKVPVPQNVFDVSQGLTLTTTATSKGITLGRANAGIDYSLFGLTDNVSDSLNASGSLFLYDHAGNNLSLLLLGQGGVFAQKAILGVDNLDAIGSTAEAAFSLDNQASNSSTAVLSLRSPAGIIVQHAGNGSPEGSIFANSGSIFFNGSCASSGTCAYLKTGTGVTGWKGIATTDLITSTDLNWTYNLASNFIRNASTTTDLVLGSTATSTGAPAYFDLSGVTSGTSNIFFGFNTSSNVFVGGSSTTADFINSNFAFTGKELFVGGNIASVSSVYSNGEFVTGPGGQETLYGNGFVTRNDGSFLLTTNSPASEQNISFISGTGTSSAGGNVNLIAGGSSSFTPGGSINLRAGDSSFSGAGNITLTPGDSMFGNPGNIFFTPAGTSNQPRFIFGSIGGGGIGIQAPNSANSLTLTLPDVIPASSTALLTDGSGTLSFGSVCLTDGTNCPASSGDLQQVSDIGASTTNQLYLFGGFIASSSTVTSTLTVLGDTSLQNVTAVYATATTSSLAYVSSSQINVRPVTPVLLSSTALSSSNYDVKVVGQYAYDLSQNELNVVDISDPVNPKIVGTQGGFNNDVSDVIVRGNYAYVPMRAYDLYSAIDLRNPSKPRTVSTSTVNNLDYMTVDGSYLYVVASGEGLKVYDNGDPVNPLLLSTASAPSLSAGRVVVRNGYAYAVDYNTGVLFAFDVHDPRNAGLVGTLTIDAALVAQDLDVSGRYAYVASINSFFGGNALNIIDISNPATMRNVATTTSSGASNSARVRVFGDYAYFVQDSSLIVVDVSSSTSPFIVTQYTAGGSIQNFDVKGHYAYLADSNNLEIVDLYGLDAQNGRIGSLETDTAHVNDRLIVGGFLNVQSAINVGLGGINSDGALTVYSTNTTSTIYGTVSTSRLYVNGSLVCLATGVNCSSGVPSLQQVTNVGATTSQKLTLYGGFLSGSSTVTSTLNLLGRLNFTSATTGSSFRIGIPVPSIDSQLSNGITVSSTGQASGLNIGTTNISGFIAPLLSFSENLNAQPFSTTGSEIYYVTSTNSLSLYTQGQNGNAGTLFQLRDLSASSAVATTKAAAQLSNFSTNSSTAILRLTNGNGGGSIVEHVGSGTPEGTVFANAGSIYFNVAGTSSGTQAYVKTQNANSSGWVGIATTDQLTGTPSLQQVTNVGATTSNMLTLYGGFLAGSSTVTSTLNVLGRLNFTSATAGSSFQIGTPAPANDLQSSIGLTVSSTGQSAGLQLGTTNISGFLSPFINFAQNLTETPFVSTGSQIYYVTSSNSLGLNITGQNGNAAALFQLRDLNASGTTSRAAAQLFNFSSNSSTAVLRLGNSFGGGIIVQHVGIGSPEGVVYANAGSVYFNGNGTASGTQAYLKTQNANSSGWVGIATTDLLSNSQSLQQVSNVGATTSNMLTLYGGFLAGSSTVTSTLNVLGALNFTSATTGSSFRIGIPVPTIDSQLSNGITVSSTGQASGLNIGTFNVSGFIAPVLSFSENLNLQPFSTTGSAIYYVTSTNSLSLYTEGQNGTAATLFQIRDLNASNTAASTRAAAQLSNFATNSSTAILRLTNGNGGGSIVEHVGSGTPEGSVYANAGSVYFNVGGTSSGTQAYLKTQNANSSGWVGIATTDQISGTPSLQQVSNVGASTTNLLYLFGGVTTPSSTVTSTFTSIGSANFYPSTGTQPVTINLTPSTSTSGFVTGLQISSTNTSAGTSLFRFNQGGNDYSGLLYANNVSNLSGSGTIAYFNHTLDQYAISLFGATGISQNAAQLTLNNLDETANTNAKAALGLSTSNVNSSTAALSFKNNSGSQIVQHFGSGSPEGSVYANAGSIYFNASGLAEGTQAYLKTKNANSTGWVGIVTTNMRPQDLNWTYNITSDFINNATPTTDIVLGSYATSTGAPAYFDLSGSTNGTSTIYFGNATNVNVVVGGTSTTNTGLNPNFVLNGNDLFVSGNIGSASSVYTNGEFVAGASSTRFGNGYITKNDTGPLQITTVSGTAITNDLEQLWSTNSNLTRISTFTLSKPSDFIVRGQYIYAVSNQTDLEVIDITDPYHPLERTFLTMPANITSIQADERYIYLQCSDTNIYAIDISLPGGPSNAGAIPFTSGKMILQGDILYSLKNTGISIFRLNGLSVSLLGTVGGSFTGVTAFAVRGNYAYVGNNSLHVIDVSDPTSPSEVGTLLYGPFLRGFATDDTYVYGTDSTSTHVAIFDVHKPNVPTLAATVTGFGAGGQLTKSGRYLYVADDVGFEVTDVLSTSSAAIKKTITALAAPTKFVVDGRYGYAIEGLSGTDYLSIYKLPTTEVEALAAQSLQAGTARIMGNAEVVGTINAYGLNVGKGGITSKGPVNVNNTLFLNLPNSTSTSGFVTGLQLASRNLNYGLSAFRFNNTDDFTGIGFSNSINDYNSSGTITYFDHTLDQYNISLLGTNGISGSNGALFSINHLNQSDNTNAAASFAFQNNSTNSSTAVLQLENGQSNEAIVQHVGGGSPEGVVYANAGSIYFNAAGTASGTQAYLKTQNNNKSGWVGIATTDSSGGSLQAVSDIGATTTNKLYLLGGLNVSSTFTFEQATNTQPLRVTTVATTSTPTFIIGQTITATNSNTGTSFWQLDGGTGNYSGLAFSDNVYAPFTGTSTGIYSSNRYALGSIYSQNAQGDLAYLQVAPLSGYNQAAPFNFLSSGSVSSTAIVAITNGEGTVVFHHGKGNPENSVYANLGSLFFRNDGYSSGTQAYIKTQNANQTGWVGLATVDMLSGGGFTETITTSTSIIQGTDSNGTLAVQGDIAVTTRYGASIFNVMSVANTATSTVMSTTTLSGAWLPVLNKNVLYVFDWNNGILNSYGLDDLRYPNPLATLRGFSAPYAAKLVGSYLYVGDDAGLKIVDVSDPGNPRMLRQLTLSGGTKRGLTLKDGYLYLTTQSGGSLYVVDVHNPSNPYLVNTVSISGAREIAAQDAYLYVGASTAPYLKVYDIRAATSPRLIASVVSNIGSVTDIAVAGNSLYVADATSTYRYDVTNPSSPSFVDRLLDTSAGDHRIAVSNNRLYSYNHTTGRLHIYDFGGLDVNAIRSDTLFAGLIDVGQGLNVRGPSILSGGLNVGPSGVLSLGPVSAPLFQSRISTTGTELVATVQDGTGNSTQANMIATQGNYMYSVSGAFATLNSFDISDPTNPKFLGSVSTGLGNAQSLVVAGNRAFVGGSGGTVTVDISDPVSMARLGTYSAPVNQTPLAEYLSGKYLYSIGSNKFVTYDITDPATIQYATSSATSTGATWAGVAFQGRYAYMANGAGSPQTAMQIIDVSNPTSSRYVGFIQTTSAANDVAVAGRYAYVANSTNGLTIWDVSAPTATTFVSGYTLPTRSAISLADRIKLIDNKYAVVGYGDNGLVIFDISSSTRPVPVYQFMQGLVAASGVINSFAIQGRYIYFWWNVSGSPKIGVLELQGADFPTASIGSLKVANLSVGMSGNIANELTVGSGLYVGGSGVFSEGPISVYATNSTSSFAGAVWAKNLWVSDSFTAPSGTPMNNWREVIRYTSSSQAGGLCIDDSTTANTCPPTGINGTSIFADGNITANAFDLAERYTVSGDSAPGDVLVFDSATSATVKRSTGIPYDPHLAGVISSQPGLRLGWLEASSSVDVALTGRVPVNVNMENGPILIGDPLTSSHVPGVAMKAKRPGMIIGYALADAFTTSTIEVFMNVGYSANTALNTDGSLSILGDDLVVGSTSTASALQNFSDSWGLTFRGSVWDGATSATNRDFTLLTDVISATSSAFTIRNASSSDLFTLDASGTVRSVGDLGIMGRIYPSARGTFQNQYYLFVDDSSSTNQYISTNADGWQSQTSYDLAERYHAADKLASGDLVTANPSEALGIKKAVSGSVVLGVVSTKPGFILGRNATDTYPIALTGRVPTKVSAANGAIHAGDLLAPSDTAGVAVKASANGQVVGIALEDYSGAETGLIQVFIAPHWDGSFSSGASGSSGPSASAPAGVSGFADIAAGSLTVGVHYSSLGAYPNIRIAPYGQVDGVWWIDSVTDSSFRIVFSQAQSHDVRFSWTAVPSQTGDYLYNSDGTFGTINPTTGVGPAMGPGSTTGDTGSGSASGTDSGASSSTDSGTGSTTSTDSGSGTSTTP